MIRISQKIALPLSIFMFSFFLSLLWGNFSIEAFLIDDNRTQWFPVLERAYSEFFASGKMPVYDFFQLKGFSIAEQGYYSIMNPLMMLSYVIAHFTPLHFSTITIYVALMFSAGNVVFFRLCDVLHCKFSECLLLTVAYSSISIYFSFSYWYYVFNNYLLIPLLLLVFLRSRNHVTEYFGCGLILAFEILLGNVQYTCYHYMVYGLFCLTYILLKQTRYIKIFFTNVICAGILSAPFLLLLLRASTSFGNGEFLSYSLNLADILLGALLPLGILDEIGLVPNRLFSMLMGRGDKTWLYNGAFAGFWLILAFYAGKILAKKLKSSNLKENHTASEWKSIIWEMLKQQYHAKIVQPDGSHCFLIATFVCWGFFVSFTRGGIVAMVLSILPVIKQFRYLFKAMFVVQPLLAVLTAGILPHIRGSLKKYAVSVCCVLAVVGMVNNGMVVSVVTKAFTEKDRLSLAEEQQTAETIIQENQLDLQSYRYLTLLGANSNGTDIFRYYNGFLRNFATATGVFSIGAYEISAPSSRLESISHLYDTQQLFARLGNYGNIEDFLSALESSSSETIYELRSNAIKYIFVEKSFGNMYFVLSTQKGFYDERESQLNQIRESYLKNQHYAQKIAEKLNDFGVSVTKIISVNELLDVVVLEDDGALCQSSSGESLPLTAKRMDLLSFEADTSSEYTLSFTYEDNLCAWGLADDGTQTALSILPDEDGNSVIHVSEGWKGRIYLSYEDKLSTIAFLFEILISVFFFVFMAILEISEFSSKKAPA